jgi:hypothetical protein
MRSELCRIFSQGCVPRGYSRSLAFLLMARGALCQATATDLDLHSFEYWRIVQIRPNNSYQLIGGTTSAKLSLVFFRWKI